MKALARALLFALMALVANVCHAYSYVPLSFEELAAMSTCVVDGTIQSESARRVGAGIRTDHVLSVKQLSGTCENTGSTMMITTFGGRLSNGEEARVAGIAPLMVGQHYLLLLEPDDNRQTQTGRSLRLVEGPQGSILLSPTASGKVTAQDSAGQAIVGTRRTPGSAADGSPVAKFSLPAASPSTNMVRRLAAESMDFELEPTYLFQLAAELSRNKLPGEKAKIKRELIERLHGKPETGRDDAAGSTVAPALSGPVPTVFVPAIRRVDCVTLPEPSAKSTGDCAGQRGNASLPEYTTTGIGGARAWNVPPNLNTFGDIAKAMMSEWNRYANQFRIFTAPENTYGLNDRNDIAGFVADLGPIYGEAWSASSLGVTITRSGAVCLVITREYFLGILIREYCSTYSGTESDILLNPAASWTYDDFGARTRSDNRQSIHSVLAHELGHGFGLGHSAEIAVMSACDSKRDWAMWPDDATGARAVWPGQAVYGPSVGIRFYSFGSPYSCGQPAAPTFPAYRETAQYVPSTRQIFYGSFAIMNLDNQAKSGVEIEWYVTGLPGSFAGTYTFLGTTPVGTVNPGITFGASGSLFVPTSVTGSGYLTAFIRNAGSTGASVDGFPTFFNFNPPVDQTINFPDPGFQLRNSNGFIPVATSSSGLPVTLTSQTPGVCTVSGASVIPAIVGTCIVTASQGGDGNYYYPAPSVTRSIEIIADIADGFPANCALPTSGWTNNPAGSTAGWSVATDSFFSGPCSLKSNLLSDAAQPGAANVNKAQIQFTGTFIAGNVTFARRVSSESNWDCLRFLVDGEQKSIGGACASIGGIGTSGEVAWGGFSVPVTAGAHTLIWSYEKDSSVSIGADAAWIDRVVLPLFTVAQTITFAPTSPVALGVPPITLTATASSGLTSFTFSTSSASSICTVTDNQLTIVGVGTCALTASQAGDINYASASANANVVIGAGIKTLTVAVVGTGRGSVTGTGINCPGDCSETVVQNTAVTLTATPATGSIFTGWSGGCTGTGSCTVTMSTTQSVTAQFTRQLGSLGITLAGLPVGNSVVLAIAGPDGYNNAPTVATGSTLSLSSVPTGSYTVTAPSKSIAGTFYVPNARLQSTVVNVGMAGSVTVTYGVSVLPLNPIIFFLLD